MYVRSARTYSNGCKSLNRPDSGKVTAKGKGKESHTMWHQAILGKNLRKQQQGILGKCEPHVRWCERSAVLSPPFFQTLPAPHTISFRENVLSGTKWSWKPVLCGENVLGGTKVVYRTELKPSVSTQFRSGRSSGRRRCVSALRPEVRADMPG